MSTRLSPDGMYYWDGQQWLSTLSHDGRSRWNGSAWVPTGQGGPPAGYQAARATTRQPTSWTRPLQIAVAAWYAFQGIYGLTIPFWMSGPIAEIMNQSIERQQRLNPSAAPPPADFMNLMASIMSVAIWVGVLIGLAFAVVVVVGALKRWTWIYYVVLIFLGLGAISLPLNVVNAFGGSAITGASMPSWIYWLGVVTSIPGTAIFVWMLVAIIKRGPWGMTRVAPPVT